MAKKTKKNSGIREKTHKGVDNVMDKAESMRESGEEKLVNLKEDAIKVRENFDGYIQKNPEKSVLIAAGIGMATGAILAATIIKKKQ